MRIITAFVTFILLASPVLAASKTFNDVAVVDVSCSKMAASDPDSHTKDCALKCQKSGYGVVTADKQFLKFDADGNAKILEQLKLSGKPDHLRVNVTGDVTGDTIKVTSVKLL